VSIDASQCQVVTDRLGSAARDLRALPARLDAAVAAAIRDIQGDEALRDIAPQLTAKLGATADATKVVVGAILAIVDRAARFAATGPAMLELAIVWRLLARDADGVAGAIDGAAGRLGQEWNDAASQAYVTIVPPGQITALHRLSELAGRIAGTLTEAFLKGLTFAVAVAAGLATFLTVVTPNLSPVAIANIYFLARQCHLGLTAAERVLREQLATQTAALEGMHADADFPWPTPAVPGW
jgi:hypothetical protein